MGLHTKVAHSQVPYFRPSFLARSLKTVPKSKIAPSLALQQLSRSLSTQGTVVSQASQTDAWKRLGITAVRTFISQSRYGTNSYALLLKVAVGGTIFVANAFLNRDTRDALSPVEKSYLNESFTYTGGGLAITALVARTMFKNGFTYRVMRANPCTYLSVYSPPRTYILCKRGGSWCELSVRECCNDELDSFNSWTLQWQYRDYAWCI